MRTDQRIRGPESHIEIEIRYLEVCHNNSVVNKLYISLKTKNIVVAAETQLVTIGSIAPSSVMSAL